VAIAGSIVSGSARLLKANSSLATCEVGKEPNKREKIIETIVRPFYFIRSIPSISGHRIILSIDPAIKARAKLYLRVPYI
jgi:hypothetical protein